MSWLYQNMSRTIGCGACARYTRYCILKFRFSQAILAPDYCKEMSSKAIEYILLIVFIYGWKSGHYFPRIENNINEKNTKAFY